MGLCGRSLNQQAGWDAKTEGWKIWLFTKCCIQANELKKKVKRNINNYTLLEIVDRRFLESEIREASHRQILEHELKLTITQQFMQIELQLRIEWLNFAVRVSFNGFHTFSVRLKLRFSLVVSSNP